MSEDEVQLEMQSIQAIFSEEIELESARQIVVHCAAQIRLNLCLPPEYPSMAPSIELCAPSVGGEEKRHLLAALDKICAEHRGEPMLYPLIERALEFFAERRSKEEEGPAETQSEPAEMADDGCGASSAFYSGLTIEDRKSKFQAHVAKLQSKDQIPSLLSQLKNVGKIARATHNTYAWRILFSSTNEDGTRRQIEQHDCDDDGENGAGSKLLRLVVQMNAQGVLVVVSRWYGGRHLGPDRFRHICNAAREALVSGGFVKDPSNS